MDDDDDDKLVKALIKCLEKQCHPPNYPISEVIYTREHPSFETILNKRITNLRFSQPTTRKPLLIVAPNSELNIPAVITCARTNQLKVKIRSGGHDYEGISCTDKHSPFILLDMFNLNAVDVSIEEETAWVQSGAKLGFLYYKIAEKSNVHAFPGGLSPNVGVGGHFSGGGYGNLMRKYGLSGDNIVDARVVDASGRILDRKGMREDFFWALLGGGGSSFGVILAWKLKLVRVPPSVTVFQLPKDVSAPGVNRIIYKWQEVSYKLPKDLFLRVEYKTQKTEDGSLTMMATFISLYLGDSKSLLAIMDESFPELGVTHEACKQMSWIDSVLFWDHQPEGTTREILLNYKKKAKYFHKIKGDFVKKPIPEVALPQIWDEMKGIGEYYMAWTPYGGRMDEIEPSATPFPHRKGNLYMIYYYLLWPQDDITEPFLNKLEELYAFMKPYVANSPRRTILNYVDLDLVSSGEKYFLDNFPKLVDVKTQVDSSDFFCHEQSIPTFNKLCKNTGSKRA